MDKISACLQGSVGTICRQSISVLGRRRQELTYMWHKCGGYRHHDYEGTKQITTFLPTLVGTSMKCFNCSIIELYWIRNAEIPEIVMIPQHNAFYSIFVDSEKLKSI